MQKKAVPFIACRRILTIALASAIATACGGGEEVISDPGSSMEAAPGRATEKQQNLLPSGIKWGSLQSLQVIELGETEHPKGAVVEFMETAGNVTPLLKLDGFERTYVLPLALSRVQGQVRIRQGMNVLATHDATISPAVSSRAGEVSLASLNGILYNIDFALAKLEPRLSDHGKTLRVQRQQVLDFRDMVVAAGKGLAPQILIPGEGAIQVDAALLRIMDEFHLAAVKHASRAAGQESRHPHEIGARRLFSRSGGTLPVRKEVCGQSKDLGPNQGDEAYCNITRSLESQQQGEVETRSYYALAAALADKAGAQPVILGAEGEAASQWDIAVALTAPVLAIHGTTLPVKAFANLHGFASERARHEAITGVADLSREAATAYLITLQTLNGVFPQHWTLRLPETPVRTATFLFQDENRLQAMVQDMWAAAGTANTVARRALAQVPGPASASEPPAKPAPAPAPSPASPPERSRAPESADEPTPAASAPPSSTSGSQTSPAPIPAPAPAATRT